MNEDRRRWYGLRVGDTVTFMGQEATVTHLYSLDNNGCRLQDSATGREHDAVCEWCQVKREVEAVLFQLLGIQRGMWLTVCTQPRGTGVVEVQVGTS